MVPQRTRAELEAELERQQAELERLRERARFLNGVMEASDVVIQLAPDGTLLDVNRVVALPSKSESVGKNIMSFLDEEARARFAPLLESVARTLEPRTIESPRVLPDGTKENYRLTVSAVAKDGVLESFALVANNIRERMEVESALRDTQEKLHLALRASGIGLWRWERGTDTIVWDAATCAILGVDDAAQPRSYQDFLDRVHPNDRHVVETALMTTLTTGVYEDLEHRIIRPDGQVRFILSRGATRRNAEGEVVALLGGVVDISRMKALQSELAQAQKLESVGRLAGGIAHDFNNMLTVITGTLCEARELLTVGHEADGFLVTALDAASRSAGLTRQLLLFARKQPVVARPLDLSDAVERLRPLLGRLLLETVSLNIAVRAGLVLKMDATQLEQLFINLSVNAQDAMPDGGTLTITIEDANEVPPGLASAFRLADGPFACLRFSDTGKGIDEAVLPHIFEPFFTSKETGHGTGLGLATCYGIVVQNGGAIQVESKIDRGTTFSIYLPQADASSAVFDTHEKVAPDQPSLSDITVLVVEDQDSVRQLVVRILRRRGCRVLEAATGREAMKVANAHQDTIDVVLTDMVMPGGSGWELCNELRKTRPGIHLMVMSGYHEKESRVPSATLLRKPFTPTALYDAVLEALGNA